VLLLSTHHDNEITKTTQASKIQPNEIHQNITQENFPFPKIETWTLTIRYHETQKKETNGQHKVIMDEHDLSHITPTSPAEPIHPRC